MWLEHTRVRSVQTRNKSPATDAQKVDPLAARVSIVLMDGPRDVVENPRLPKKQSGLSLFLSLSAGRDASTCSVQLKRYLL